MITTKDFGALAGVAEPEAAVDPNAPVELPRRCGLCAHFRRCDPATTSSLPARSARFGSCTRQQDIAQPMTASFAAASDPFDRGPVGIVGDLFGCAFFEARR